MPKRVLKQEGWERLTLRYPEWRIVDDIFDRCEYWAHVGYEGCRTSVTIHPDLSRAAEDPSQVTAEIRSQLEKDWLEVYPARISTLRHYTTSPLGLTV